MLSEEQITLIRARGAKNIYDGHAAIDIATLLAHLQKLEKHIAELETALEGERQKRKNASAAAVLAFERVEELVAKAASLDEQLTDTQEGARCAFQQNMVLIAQRDHARQWANMCASDSDIALNLDLNPDLEALAQCHIYTEAMPPFPDPQHVTASDGWRVGGPLP